MKDTVARKLLALSKHDFTPYVEERLDILRKGLEMATDMSEVNKLQGQIKEVRRLLTLREEIENTLKG